jgi:hypothetical protein
VKDSAIDAFRTNTGILRFFNVSTPIFFGRSYLISGDLDYFRYIIGLNKYNSSR